MRPLRQKKLYFLSHSIILSHMEGRCVINENADLIWRLRPPKINNRITTIKTNRTSLKDDPVLALDNIIFSNEPNLRIHKKRKGAPDFVPVL